MQMQPHRNLQWLEGIALQEEAEREQKRVAKISREKELLLMLRNEPQKLIDSKRLYQEFMETFFFIRPKGRGLQQFSVNNSQQILVDAFFLLKDKTPYVRINILKGRQQGMSTLIGAFAVMEMLLHPSTGALIATENQSESGKNLYRMYELYLQEFQKLMREHLDQHEWLWKQDVTDRFSFGKECFLANDSLFSVVGETNVTSKTLQFIHLSEAAFYHHLDDCLGMMLQTLPIEPGTFSSMFIETTAKMYGNEHHEGWEASCDDKSAFKPLFIPWYVHKEYEMPFRGGRDGDEFKEFKKSLGESTDDQFGNEKALLETNNSAAPWRQLWPGLDFKKYGYDHVTYENLNFRRYKINEMKGLINEFNRQYPTTPDDAFLSKSAHVLDMDAIRWYMAHQREDPDELGIMRASGPQHAEFVQQRGGIVAVWEHPLPYREYIIGVDVAEGFDTGDYSCAYVVSRLPFKVVARLRGAEGRAVGLEELENQLFALGHYYNTASICVENNGSGEAVTSGLQRLGYPNQVPEDNITLGNSGRFGWRSARGADGIRVRAVSYLQEVIADRTIGIPCEQFFREAHHFHFINGRAQAARKGQQGGSNVGKHDDCMLAMCGVLLANSVLPRVKTEHEVREQQAIKIRKRQARESFKNTKKYTDPKRFV